MPHPLWNHPRVSMQNRHFLSLPMHPLDSYPLQVFQTIQSDAHVQSPSTIGRAPTIEFAPETARSSATLPRQRQHYMSLGRGRRNRPLSGDIDIPTRIDERTPPRSRISFLHPEHGADMESQALRNVRTYLRMRHVPGPC